MRSAGAEATYSLEAIGVRRAYGDVVALDNVSLSVAPGEFLTLLGPSGSGKTTLLHIVAGLQTPSSITALRIAGEDVRHHPAHRRNVTTVFQQYALFPHLSVGENVEYGLRVRGVVPAARQAAARRLLELVRLPHVYDRRVHQLSGGERQRVALARALAPQPQILLLDEPLGALDEKLRLDMQVELHDLQRRLGMSFIYVTHSQEEALTMSDRIVLMARGRIVQSGGPRDLYQSPQTRFAAVFMGVENVFDGIVEQVDGDAAVIRVDGEAIRAPSLFKHGPAVGAAASLIVRAEHVRIGDAAPEDGARMSCIACAPRSAVYKGKYLDQTLESALGPIVARIWDQEGAQPAAAAAWWKQEDSAIVPLQ